LGNDLDEHADYSAMLGEQWRNYQYEKGWNLGQEWMSEAADFYGPGDHKIEADERRKKNVVDDSESEV